VGALMRLALAAGMLFAGPAHADPVDHWRGIVEQASVRFGIPARWIEQVIRAESNGQTTVAGHPIRSRAGAMGLMQLMPATWATMRFRLGLGPDPDDPRDNIMAGSLFLRLLYDRFGYPGLFAAYNAGPALYARHLAGRASLPAETRAYLAKVRIPPASVIKVPSALFVVRRDQPQADEAPAPPAASIFALQSDNP
jgi:soluble lytic murein transglycosylase-like protein